MFIRKCITTSKKTGRSYINFSIVDNERIGASIIQKVILNLGSNFDLPQEKWTMLVEKIERHINNEKTLFETSFNKKYEALAKSLADKLIAKRT
jgi:hypothetical protein